MTRSAVSVIVPTLDEERELPGALQSVLAQAPGALEVIVADGGSTDGTAALVPTGVRLVRSPRGRPIQMNAGAAAASGRALLFLHADCRLPRGALAAVEAALHDPGTVGGGFHKRFHPPHPLLAAPAWRTRLWHRLGAVFGDQALFVRRSAFERVGGFRTGALAEDFDLARRLRRLGHLALIPAEVTTSSRRLREHGVLRTWCAWWRIVAGELAGRPTPDVLYPDVRTPDDVSSGRGSGRGSSGC